MEGAMACEILSPSLETNVSSDYLLDWYGLANSLKRLIGNAAPEANAIVDNAISMWDMSDGHFLASLFVARLKGWDPIAPAFLIRLVSLHSYGRRAPPAADTCHRVRRRLLTLTVDRSLDPTAAVRANVGVACRIESSSLQLFARPGALGVVGNVAVDKIRPRCAANPKARCIQ
jgi:hypothetical protein